MGYNNNNSGNHFNKNTGNQQHPKKTKKEYQEEKARQIAIQTKSLEIIGKVAEYLNDFIVNRDGYKITMREILAHLNDELGYSIEETKVVSQFNYLMMELANCRKNKNISGDRLNIRVMYIEERLKTSFKSEIHDIAMQIINNNGDLFHWDETSNGEGYTSLPEKE